MGALVLADDSGVSLPRARYNEYYVRMYTVLSTGSCAQSER